MTRILVVDDEPQILRALRINLKTRKYEVETAATGVEALAIAARRLPDAVLLDLGLPDMDGVEVILGLRGWTQVPIVVLSGRAGAQEKIAALDAGADDYVTKPFAMEELLARLRAVLRRRVSADGTRPEESTIVIGHCTIDLAAHTVLRGGGGAVGAGAVGDAGAVSDAGAVGDAAEPPGPVRLTRTEWGLLEVLLKHPGQLVTSARLLAEVWGEGYDTEAGYLRFHIARLRRKLEIDPRRPRHFLTEYGVGYRFVP